MTQRVSRENVEEDHKGVMKWRTVTVDLHSHQLHSKLTAASVITQKILCPISS